MKTLIIKGARNSTLAIHRCENPAQLDELLAVYHALGYEPEALIVQDEDLEQAA